MSVRVLFPERYEGRCIFCGEPGDGRCDCSTARLDRKIRALKRARGLPIVTHTDEPRSAADLATLYDGISRPAASPSVRLAEAERE